MNVVSFLHEGLGNSSYLVPLGEGAALLVDPDRTVERYLDAARARDWTITHVFETHLHADFVSGALEVRAATGAEIFHPAASEVCFPHRPLTGGDAVPAPGASITTLASPGHTPEHLSYVVELGGRAPMLFSGGSLLAGGAARTDLIDPRLTDSLTRAQFRTITRAFRHLPDETSLLPTHGGGSFCSSGGTGERVSTLGAERRTNPLFLHEDEDEFAHWFPTTFPAAPGYFFRLRTVNRGGPRLRSRVPAPGQLDPEEFDRLRAETVVIDVRPQGEYLAAHIPGSISIAFRDAFATWLGWLAPMDRGLLLVLGEEPLETVLDECLLVGYEGVRGVLGGGISAWTNAGLPTAQARLEGVETVRSLLVDGALGLDVREPQEFAAGHIPRALHIPLGELASRASELPVDRPIVTYCGHGERSATALSLLERLGFRSLINFDGGFGAWQQAGLEVQR